MSKKFIIVIVSTILIGNNVLAESVNVESQSVTLQHSLLLEVPVYSTNWDYYSVALDMPDAQYLEYTYFNEGDYPVTVVLQKKNFLGNLKKSIQLK